MLRNNFLGIDEKYSSYNNSKTVIIPVPYEATTCYMGGTQNGPAAIIKASSFVELYDEELDSEIYKSGIFTKKQLKFINKVDEDFDKITKSFQHEINAGKFPVGLGGEHSISFPIYKAFHNEFNNLSVLQLDAHSDLRDTYENSLYSHACVMKRIFELNESIFQVGIRSQCKEESELIKQNRIVTHYAYQIKKTGLIDSIIDKLEQNVFITIDVDYFDPAIMPSTGTPEPGGFLWDETIAFLKKVFKKRNVVGFDIVELSPIKGVVHPDFTVAKLIYKLIGFKFS